MAARTVELCSRTFAVLHSGVTRGPLYSAEHLTRDSVTQALGVVRANRFHPDARLPRQDRAEMRDYAASGYDRGHMAPSGDMPDAASQAESLALSNMVPQAPALNRGLWEHIEAAVRDMAVQRGELFAVTGPVFAGETLSTIGRVLVPSSTWKAVLDPATGTAGAWVAANDASGDVRAVSLAELAGITGLEVFPGLAPERRAAAMALPQVGR